MGLQKSDTKPMPGATQHPGAPAELNDETTAAGAATAVADAPDFDPTPTGTSVNQPPAVAAKASGGSMIPGLQQDQDGFNALDDQIKFGSFPTIKLENGKFVVGDEELTEFDCQMLGLRPKYIHKTVPKSKDDNGEFVYSYDDPKSPEARATDGRFITAVIAEWKEDGEKYDGWKEYMEPVVLMRNTSLANSMALLSIPPASTGRLAGLRQQIKFVNGEKLSDIIVTCRVGAKATTKAKKVFNPWDFKRKCKVDEYVEPAPAEE